MAADFVVGDVVELKSGGPPMTVETLGDYSGMSGGPENGAYCVWFQNAKKTGAVFDLAMLRKVD